ncbi:33230_t:CDS:2, partial [Gigaspora margarita]
FEWFVDEFKTESSSANNTSSKHVKVESCNESENESNYTDSNSIKFNKFTRLNEDVHDNIYNNLLRKENSQKNKKRKEPVGGSLRSALRSYKSSNNEGYYDENNEGYYDENNEGYYDEDNDRYCDDIELEHVDIDLELVESEHVNAELEVLESEHVNTDLNILESNSFIVSTDGSNGSNEIS